MTEFDYGKSPLPPYQQARAEALKTAASVLSASSGFVIAQTKQPPKEIDSLLRVADWVLGPDPIEASPDVRVMKVRPDDVPSLFEFLSRSMPDCGHPECPIHAPAREAQDLNPEDAKSSFDHEPPVDFNNTGQTGMAEASDFEGGEADAEMERKIAASYPPQLSPSAFALGTVMNGRDGKSWEVSSGLSGSKYWKRLSAEMQDDVAEYKEDSDDDIPPAQVDAFTGTAVRGLPDPNSRHIGERFVVGDRVYQVAGNHAGEGKVSGHYWFEIEQPADNADGEGKIEKDDEDGPW